MTGRISGRLLKVFSAGGLSRIYVGDDIADCIAVARVSFMFARAALQAFPDVAVEIVDSH